MGALPGQSSWSSCQHWARSSGTTASTWRVELTQQSCRDERKYDEEMKRYGGATYILQVWRMWHKWIFDNSWPSGPEVRRYSIHGASVEENMKGSPVASL